MTITTRYGTEILDVRPCRDYPTSGYVQVLRQGDAAYREMAVSELRADDGLAEIERAMDASKKGIEVVGHE